MHSPRLRERVLRKENPDLLRQARAQELLPIVAREVDVLEVPLIKDLDLVPPCLRPSRQARRTGLLGAHTVTLLARLVRNDRPSSVAKVASANSTENF